MAGRSATKIADAIKELGSSPSLTPLQLDVTDQQSISKAAENVTSQFGKLDILINNAGIAPEGPDLATMFQTTFATNVFGPVLVSAAFRELLLKSESPYSIYVSSKVGSFGLITDPSSHLHGTGAGSVAYRASKSALNMVMLHEQLELKDTNIKIFAMCPGYVVSNLRGTSDEQRSGYGRAGSPDVSAETVLAIIRGERDGESATLLGSEGSLPW